MTEYIIIVFLVAVGTIGAVGLFGDNLRSLFGASSDALAGQTSVQAGAQTASSGLKQWSMSGQAQTKYGLGSGGTSNSANPGEGPGGTANMPAP
jgi:Flp pilus assembly pilin Flp